MVSGFGLGLASCFGVFAARFGVVRTAIQFYSGTLNTLLKLYCLRVHKTYAKLQRSCHTTSGLTMSPEKGEPSLSDSI